MYYEDTAAVIVFTFLAFVLLWLSVAKATRMGWLSASSLCMLGLMAYSMAVPIHHLFNGDYPDPEARIATALCGIAALGLFIGISLGRHLGLTRPIVERGERYESIRAGFFVTFVGIGSALLAVALTVGFTAYIEAGYAGRALLKREAGPVELGLYYAVIGYLFIAYDSLFPANSRRSALITWFLVGFLILFVAYVSFLGIRRPTFFIACSLLVMVAYGSQRAPSLLLLLAATVGAIVFGVFAQFRQVLSDHGFDASIQYIAENFSLAWLDLSATELGAPFRALLDVLVYWAGDPPRMGSTYLEAIPNLLPSSILKYKDSLSVEYTNRMFSTAYVAIGGNMGFFPVAEGYLNFGALGVFIQFVVVGTIVGALEMKALSDPRPAIVVAYCIMPAWFVFLMRADTASFLKVFFYSVVPAFVLYFFYFYLRALLRVALLHRQAVSERAARHLEDKA